ncbi:MAG: hypothetical protein MZV70_56555 [Desulfobacterales bacterium]|nr:hypothetical protein [Desulfobacterales bacterium]
MFCIKAKNRIDMVIMDMVMPDMNPDQYIERRPRPSRRHQGPAFKRL